MATRTPMIVLREMALVKAQCKSDPAIMAALLAPLEAELKAMAEFSARQGELRLSQEEAAMKKVAK